MPEVDFVFGTGLYMAPSNMQLRIGTVHDYNNEIVIATNAQVLGVNNDIDAKLVPHTQTENVQSTKTKQIHSESSPHQVHNLPKASDASVSKSQKSSQIMKTKNQQ